MDVVGKLSMLLLLLYHSSSFSSQGCILNHNHLGEVSATNTAKLINRTRTDCERSNERATGKRESPFYVK